MNRRWLLAGICGAAAVGAATAGLGLSQERARRIADARVEHTREVIDTAGRLLSSIQDSDTGQRTYLLTGNPIDLGAYKKGYEEAQRSLTALQGLTRDNPAQQDRLSQLGDLLASEDQTVALAEAARANRGASVPRADDDNLSLARTRQTIAMVTEQEQQLLRERKAAARALERQGFLIFTAMTVAPILLVLACSAALALMLMTSKTAKRVAAERQRLLSLLDLGAVMLCDLDGTIRFWSEGCERLYGWTGAQALGQLSDVLLQTAFQQPRPEIEATLRHAGEWNGELHHRTRAGSEVVVLARKILRHDVDGRASVQEIVTDTTPLHRTKAALRDSQAHLRSVVETAADGIIVTRDDGTIVSANHAGLRIFGYQQENELIGRGVGVLMPKTEAIRHSGYIAAHRAGAPPRIIGVPSRELLAVRQDGTTFPIDLSVSSFGEGKSRFLTGIVRDATARREAEKTVRDSEARLRLIQQVGEIASADWTTAGSRAFVSEQYRRLYGLAAGDDAGTFQQWLSRVHPDDRERIEAETRPLIEKPCVVAIQFRIGRPDRSACWVAMHAESFEEQGGNLRVISGHQDITDIVAAREALAIRRDELERLVAERTAALVEAEAQFRAVFDSQFQFVGVLAPDGTVLLANHTALVAGGMVAADVIGQPFWETGWWPHAERERLRAHIAEAAAGAFVRREAEVRGAGGRSVWIDVSLKPVCDPATGTVKWIIAEWRDVTKPHELADKLAQAQKLQGLGQLAGGIAHDFNNILQSLSGAAMLIERRPEDIERTRRLARSSIDAAARGASITQRLLSFAGRGALRTEVVATTDLLNSMREVLAHTLGSDITVRVIARPGLPPMLTDRRQLETALVNLGTNARDAMPGGGTLTLSAEALHVADNSADPADLAAGWYVRIDVADTGSGMDAATFARIAEPFFTTKPLGSGTGLGLAMVKGFAEQSGGVMSITSAPGAGTTVSLWLPRAMDDAVLNVTEKTRHGRIRSDVNRIMLVYDDDLIRETLALQMEELGFATLMAASGAEAIALIESGVSLDALVSDLSMPGMSGVVTIQQARALRPELPCFLLTGYAGERAALASGDNFTLVHKPISAEKLAARIEASLQTAVE